MKINSYDLRNQLSNVKDQGERSTCVSFAATAGHEYLKSNGQDLSEEFLFWACKRYDGLSIDEGTTLAAAIVSLKTNGQALEHEWPYCTNPISVCQTPPRNVQWSASNNIITCGEPIEIDTDKLKKALLQGDSVILGIKIFQEFFYPSNGYISLPADPNNIMGGHAILLVGWDDSDKSFIIRNSWGETWGANGYGYLQYDYILRYTVEAWRYRL